jgi:hypothetical protein
MHRDVEIRATRIQSQSGHPRARNAVETELCQEAPPRRPLSRSALRAEAFLSVEPRERLAAYRQGLEQAWQPLPRIGNLGATFW